MMEKSLAELIADRKKEMDRLRKDSDLFMTRDKVYRNSGLTLGDLAAIMNVNKRLLSEALNNENEEGFLRYVNSFRVKEVIRELTFNRDSHVELDTLWGNAGFGTRSAFYDNFKKVTGLSPREFHTGKIKDASER